MKSILACAFCCLLTVALSQDDYHFTVNPNIDTTTAVNQVLIKNLEQFLSTKNKDLAYHELWDTTDFSTYKYPYRDMYWTETGWPKKHNYYPTLMVIISTDTPHLFTLKIAFMEVQNESSAFLKSIYNIMATVSDSSVTFSRYTNYITRDWFKTQVGSITYISSPNREFSMDEAKAQNQFTKKLSKFFKIPEIPITYFSCTNPDEIFTVKGFDYNFQMYRHSTAGLADFNNILYSGNNRDIYSHEVVHLYLNEVTGGKLNSLLNEGLATYIAGSSEICYADHRANLLAYINENPGFDFTKHLAAYDDFYIYEDTSVPYTIGALICELAFIQGGKELLMKVVTEKDNSTVFELVGLSEENLNETLRVLLHREAVLIDI